MNRIDIKFNDLRKNNKKALITFLTAGDPNLKTTEELIYAEESSGADIIEIGVPFSDPLADGPIIQDASCRALNNGTNLDNIFSMIQSVRKNSNIPLVFLIYYNSILAYGINNFIEKCSDYGIDGLIIPDLPLEERTEFIPHIENNSLKLIPLVTPTSNERISNIIKNCGGFVYCVSSLGVTGNSSTFSKNVDSFLEYVKSNTTLPIAIGFGVSTPEDIKRFSKMCDGVIVGSKLVKTFYDSNYNLNTIKKLVSELKSSM